MVADVSAPLREAIALARQAGLAESADRLEGQAFAAFTTSSELLGETAHAIAEFVAREHGRIPPKAASLLGECLREIGGRGPRYSLLRLELWWIRTRSGTSSR